MKISLDQSAYWSRAALNKTFSHPLHIDILEDHLDTDSSILDYGCGYGRTMKSLHELGYRNLIGVDNSQGMLDRGRSLYPYLNLSYNNQPSLPFENDQFDGILLFAVMTCIPLDLDQDALMSELFRILKPGGILYLSEVLLNQDPRNLLRYQQFESEYEHFGTFELEEGVVLRHFDLQRIVQLLSAFELTWEQRFEVVTMNGNRASAIQVIGKKQHAKL